MQVYLGARDHDMLGRLASQLALTKSDVIRRALAALEDVVFNSNKHPALAVVGLVADDDGLSAGMDPALEHDRVLAEAYEGLPALARSKARGGR